MLNFELTNGDKSIEKYITKLQNDFPLSKISKTVQEDIQNEARKRGWARIPSTVKRRVISRNEHEIYLGGNAKSKDVAVYLDTGTKRHFIKPKKKAALHWVKGGKGFFSKGHFVSGIKATHFFRIYDSTLHKINAMVDKVFKS